MSAPPILIKAIIAAAARIDVNGLSTHHRAYDIPRLGAIGLVDFWRVDLGYAHTLSVAQGAGVAIVATLYERWERVGWDCRREKRQQKSAIPLMSAQA